MTRRPDSLISRVSSLALLLGCATALLPSFTLADDPSTTTPPTPASAVPAPVSFDREIQPILAARCLSCHGAGTAEAGLRLDQRDVAISELDSGTRAIVPGKPDDSELLLRVTDEAARMPPKGEPLTPAEIALLKNWIAAGAHWPAHWAYRPLHKPTPPVVANTPHADWPRTPIDHFILQQLTQRGLQPAPPAHPRTLLRRLSLDLTGISPTPAEMADFLADPSPAAYEHAVDRLLASPRYGERWARHWMDIVHFAETHGNDQDRIRPNAWPYRDYLIRAFNEDRPYARFIQEQLAGDVLFPDDPQATVATGFLATGPWDESSLQSIRDDTIDRQNARYLDRDDIVTTALSTFVSATAHCARCHDHKFDPIAQRDYYALQAVFAGIDKAERPYEPDSAVASQRRQLLADQAALPARRDRVDPTLLTADLQRQVADWEATVAASSNIWQPLDPDTFASEHGATLTKQPDSSVLSSGTLPEKDTYTLSAIVDLPRITGVRLEVLTDASLPHQGPGRQGNGNLHLNEFSLTAAPAATPDTARPIPLRNPKADFDQQGWTIALAVDGNPATAWGIYPEVGRPHQALFEITEPLEQSGPTRLTFRLQQIHGGGHLIGRVRLSVTTAPYPLPLTTDVLPADITGIFAVPLASRTDAQRAHLAAYYLNMQFDRQLAALPPLQMVFAGTNLFKPHGPAIPGARPIHLLERGDVSKPGPLVDPAALTCVEGLPPTLDIRDPQHEGQRRAAFAHWVSDDRNVLTWRSIANRLWHYHFGRGIVDTPNDFGKMGAVPTHPELLDWLAVTLRDNGGSLKQLHKLMVMSAVYQQSSQFQPKFAEIDADNQFLWRANRQRLDAESIRDSVLQATGKLDNAMGGPSVQQFVLSPGIHVTPNVDYAGFSVDDPANYRRSVYRFIFRTLPDPFMEALDCPDSSQLTPKRSSSVSALQALAMLNDKFMVRQSEHLAARAAAEATGLDAQLARIYELVLCRPPTPAEIRAVGAYAQQHGLPNACRVLLNSNEFLFAN